MVFILISYMRMIKCMRPVPVSDELCRFMGLESGSLVSKCDAVKYATEYVGSRGLRRGGRIYPDRGISSLFSVAVRETTDHDLVRAIYAHFDPDRRAIYIVLRNLS